MCKSSTVITNTFKILFKKKLVFFKLFNRLTISSENYTHIVSIYLNFIAELGNTHNNGLVDLSQPAHIIYRSAFLKHTVRIRIAPTIYDIHLRSNDI